MKFPAVAAALALTLSLGGCLPMAIFAQGGYNGYGQNFGTYASVVAPGHLAIGDPVGLVA